MPGHVKGEIVWTSKHIAGIEKLVEAVLEEGGFVLITDLTV